MITGGSFALAFAAYLEYVMIAPTMNDVHRPQETFTGTRLRTTWLSFLCVVLAGAIAGVSFLLHLNLSTTGSIELLFVVLVALRWGFIPATTASVTSAILLNYLFIPPLFALSVADPANWVSLVTFEVTALLVSQLSSKVRLHAAELELERRRNAKLYELSRAILLIESRRSASEQVTELVRELIEVETVDIWVANDSQLVSASRDVVAEGSAHETFLLGRDSNDPARNISRRLLRSGTTIIGALVLAEWESDPLLADAVASLVAIALERERAIRKESMAEAERNTERLRSAVLDGLAHCFKTPLTAIQTASSGLLAISRMTPTQTELVSIIDEETTALSRLTNRLLQTAALEANDVRLRRTPVSMMSLLREIRDEQSDSARERIAIVAGTDVPTVSADAQLLTLALLQLIDNAVKYSFVDTPIEAAVTVSEDEVIVSVTNDGEPIKVEEQERIFHRFYRGMDTAGGPTGTGLGLSIVRKTVEAHGGRAWVESNAGKTKFSLAIPQMKGSRNG